MKRDENSRVSSLRELRTPERCIEIGRTVARSQVAIEMCARGTQTALETADVTLMRVQIRA